MADITIRALFHDEASTGIAKVNSALTTMGSKVTALNTAMGTKTKSALDGVHKQFHAFGETLDVVGKRMDKVIEKVGEHFTEAAKKGVMGIVGLTAAMGTMALDIEKEVQNAALTLANFSGTTVDNPQVQARVKGMAETSAIASVQAQTKGMQQLLVDPHYRGQADVMNGALLSLAARNPADTEGTYTKLTTGVARMEAMGRANPRMTMSLAQSGISPDDLANVLGIDRSTPAGARAFQSVMTKAIAPGQMNQFIVDEAKQYGGYDPADPQKITKSENAYYQTVGGAESLAKSRFAMGVHEGLSNVDIGGAVNSMMGDEKNPGPILNMIKTFSTSVVPPMMKFFQGLLDVASKLLPVLSDIIGPIFGHIGEAFSKLASNTGLMNQLVSVGGRIGRAVGAFLNAAMPLLPTFAAGLIAVLNVLPPFITFLTPAMKLLGMVLEPIAGFMAKVTANPQVGGIIAGVAVALIAIAGAAKAREVLKEMRETLAAVKAAEGLFGKNGKLAALFGGKKEKETVSSQSIAKSTVAEMTVDLMNVKVMNGGGGGGGGNDLPGGNKAKEAERAAKDGETVLKDGETVAEDAAGGGGFLAKFLKKVPGGSRVAKLLERVPKASSLLKRVPGLGRLLGGAGAAEGAAGLGEVGADGLLVGGAEAGGAGLLGGAGAGLATAALPLLAAAGAGIGIGTIANHLMNNKNSRVGRILHDYTPLGTVKDASGWLGKKVFGSGDDDHASKSLAASAGSDSMKALYTSMLAVMSPEDRKKAENDLKHMNSSKSLNELALLNGKYQTSDAGKAVWQQWKDAQGGGGAPGAPGGPGDNHVHLNGPITVVANDVQKLKEQLAAIAQDAQRRGARQAPYGDGINPTAQRAQQGRPVS